MYRLILLFLASVVLLVVYKSWTGNYQWHIRTLVWQEAFVGHIQQDNFGNHVTTISPSETSTTNYLVDVENSTERMESRNKFLRYQCDRLKRLDNTFNKIKTLDKDLLYYSQKYEFLLCGTPKAGTSTLKRLMFRLVGINHNLESNLGQLREHLIVWSAHGREKQQEVLTSPRVVRVATVRHPTDRLVSFYLDRFFGGKSVAKPMVGSLHDFWNYYGLEHSFPVSYRQYLELILFLKMYGIHRLNQHIRPSTSLCDPCHVQYHHIIHTETLTADLHHISLHHHIPELDTDLHVHDRTGEASSIYDEYYKDIPPDILRAIYDIYKYDFILHGYKIPTFLQQVLNATTN